MMLPDLVLFLLFLTLYTVAPVPYPDGFAWDGYTPELYANGLAGARTLLVDPAGDILVLARDNKAGQIMALWEDASGVVQQSVIVQANLDLSHGMAFYQGYLYASSDTTVYRWKYEAAQRTQVANMTTPEIIVHSMNANGHGGAPQGHRTRTLALKDTNLYISVGSDQNVDADSSRSRIRVVDIQTIPAGGYDFLTAKVFADGLRNEVGLTFDFYGRLWGVENGADNLARADLGGDIHEENPAEELNLFDGPDGTFYGYPFCWTEYNIPGGLGKGRGSQWAWPDFMNDGIHTDAWCANVSNNRPPVLALPGHSAPLGITFYDGDNCNATQSFDCSMKGDAFVAFHGSWDRNVPTGYKVIRIPFTQNTSNPMPTGDTQDVFGQTDAATKCAGKANLKCMRPVNAVFRKGVMFVSSDATGEVIRIRKGSGDTSGGLSQTSGGQNHLAQMINLASATETT
ncbi:11111_t:CDS:2 [Paraglomus brasilianum]|uniref:11111_t:CDS:1 n=1 Tax=Paraglomus brasilianum TaxID=144538 RepID=A0A9N8WEF8_9GLOM|nr:11111_t:CDS:2 [Paraglomus brasilianum]